MEIGLRITIDCSDRLQSLLEQILSCASEATTVSAPVLTATQAQTQTPSASEATSVTASEPESSTTAVESPAESKPPLRT